MKKIKLLLLMLLSFLIFGCGDNKENNYEKALSLIEEQDYKKAIFLLESLDDYKESPKYLEEAQKDFSKYA